MSGLRQGLVPGGLLLAAGLLLALGALTEVEAGPQPSPVAAGGSPAHAPRAEETAGRSVHPTEDDGGASAERQQAPTLTVEVVDTRGRAFEQGMLRILPAGSARVDSHDLGRGPAVLTLPAGEYRLLLEELPAGVHEARPDTRLHPDTAPGSRRQPLYFAATEDEVTTLVVQRSSALDVQLLAGPGTELAGTEVLLEAAAHGVARSLRATRADELGRAHFDDLEPGSFTLWTELPGQPVALELTPGERHEQVLDLAVETVELEGMLVDHSGSALAGHLVQAVPAVRPLARRIERGFPATITADDGRFHLRVPRGEELRLCASHVRAVASRLGSHGQLLMGELDQHTGTVPTQDSFLGRCTLDSSQLYLIEGRTDQPGRVELCHGPGGTRRSVLPVDGDGCFAWASERLQAALALEQVGPAGTRSRVELQGTRGLRQRVQL